MEALSLPLKWHGGKRYQADRILSLFPPRDQYLHYVEPYFGGGSVLFRHDPEGKSEVVNDIDGELMNFWAVLREPCWRALYEKLQFTEMSEWVFDEAMTDVPRDSITRAWAFFVRYRQSRQGLGKCFATLSRNRTRRGMNESASSWLSAIEGLPDAHERLRRVVVLSRDALDVIRQQDGPRTVYYLDPPYLHETRSVVDAYQHEMTREQHLELLAALAQIRGRFLLSGYPSSLYATAEQKFGWRHVEWQIDNKASGADVKEIKTECVWMNY